MNIENISSRARVGDAKCLFYCRQQAVKISHLYRINKT